MTVLPVLFLLLVQSSGVADGADLFAGRVMELVAQQDAARAEALESYEVLREYRVDNEGWDKHARLTATLRFRRPDRKSFEVVSESGSGFIRDSVIRRLLTTEEEGTRAGERGRSAFTSGNYEFTLIGEEVIAGRSAYVIGAKARRRDQMLIDGRLYVDTEDLAIARIEGSLAKNPSFWITQVDFVRSYQKIGGLWLPESDVSVSHVRIFGRTRVTTSHGAYILHRRDDRGRPEVSAVGAGVQP